MNSDQQEEYMNRLRSEMKSQIVKDLLNKMTVNCFKKCAGLKGEGLDTSERNCVGNCVFRYMDTLKVVHGTIDVSQK